MVTSRALGFIVYLICGAERERGLTVNNTFSKPRGDFAEAQFIFLYFSSS